MHLKYEVLEEKLATKLDSMFAVKESLLEVNPGKVMLPYNFRDLGERIIDLEVRPDDVWLVGHPRTGPSVDQRSTWTLEILWCMMHNLDFHKALTTHLNVRSPLLELSSLFGMEELEFIIKAVVAGEDSVNQVEEMDSPRCIRSHLPYHLLPQQINTVKPKVVYIARNPKDVCVSYYHSLKLVHNLQNCSFEEFAELFMQGRAPVGPYLEHVLEFWKLRDESNFLFLTYEEMTKFYRDSVEKLSKFLEKDLSEEEVDSLMEHTSFKKMQSNPAVNNEHLIYAVAKDGDQQETKFIRKGQVGDWKNYMSEELSDKFDRWMNDKLRDTGLSFETS